MHYAAKSARLQHGVSGYTLLPGPPTIIGVYYVRYRPRRPTRRQRKLRSLRRMANAGGAFSVGAATTAVTVTKRIAPLTDWHIQGRGPAVMVRRNSVKVTLLLF
jgi:hypothetical protein